ncbi:DUF2829 domain-containing protein [Xenorhabdus budapestensis]|uniref:DUF2829 domain-containing protein n=1 Tax=Xenorhabdus budapestensis TaxID=290110 RepID=A0ABX7VJG9_XENBU|nr:DUF2829 domain-containing protein [Xenorhabdus budapestensis]QTL40590.1 DUF2829 domain-containing protein [Xenorhabdus budapestensis]
MITFGEALEALKDGKKAARSGWNGKGMWLALVQPFRDAVYTGETPCFVYRMFELPDGATGEPSKSPPQLPFIAMKTADDHMVPWLASQTDVLAEDWSVIE